MANPFISDARSDFREAKSDLRSAFEAGDLTREQFREAKDQARDIFGGFKEDVRSGIVTDYSNPFANFNYTPTGGITTLDTGTVATTTGPTTPVTQPSPFVPSYGDLYESLSPGQESRLQRLAGMYAAGELEGREGKIGKLERLLEKGDLGTLESYFSKDLGTYTAPTDLGVTLPADVSYQQLADVFRSDDPFRAYVTAQRYGLTPEQIQTISRGYQTNYYNPIQTTTGIENLLSQGQSVFTDYNLALQYIKDPNNPMFVDNPALGTRAQQVIYAYQNPIDEPITATTTNKAGETIAGSGQYGYQNNAPILNADIVDELFGDSNKVGNRAINRNQDILDELGWNFESKEDLNTMIRGVRVVGLNENVYTADALRAMDQGETYTDPNTGVTVNSYAPERDALVTAAEKLGIDPSKFESSAKLYQAIQQATDDVYVVTGTYKNQWDPEQISGISDKGNHATVMYRRVGDSLIPVSTPNLFKYQKPDDPIIGGAIGDIIANTPFLPEVVALIPGMQAYYPILKGIQTASMSGDIEDALTSGGLAWLTTNYIPKELSPYISNQIADLPFVRELALTNDTLANFIVKGGTNAAISAGLAAITGQDPLEAGIAALAQSGVLTVTKEGIDLTNIPDQYKPIVSRIIAEVVLGRDPKNSLISVAGTFVKDELSDFMKTKGKQNDVKDTEIKV